MSVKYSERWFDHEAFAEIAWIHLSVRYEEWKKGKRSNTSSYETFLAHECTLTASSLEAMRGDILSLEGEWGNILKLKEVLGDILSFETAWGTILNSKGVWGNTLSLETVGWYSEPNCQAARGKSCWSVLE